MPLIIRKSDGGYGYATTDLATIRHRVHDLRPTGSSTSSARRRRCTSRWSSTTARMAGWLPDDVEVVHVQIGNVLGPDRKILRTRGGDPSS